MFYLAGLLLTGWSITKISHTINRSCITVSNYLKDVKVYGKKERQGKDIKSISMDFSCHFTRAYHRGMFIWKK